MDNLTCIHNILTAGIFVLFCLICFLVNKCCCQAGGDAQRLVRNRVSTTSCKYLFGDKRRHSKTPSNRSTTSSDEFRKRSDAGPSGENNGFTIDPPAYKEDIPSEIPFEIPPEVPSEIPTVAPAQFVKLEVKSNIKGEPAKVYILPKEDFISTTSHDLVNIRFHNLSPGSEDHLVTIKTKRIGSDDTDQTVEIQNKSSPKELSTPPKDKDSYKPPGPIKSTTARHDSNQTSSRIKSNIARHSPPPIKITLKTSPTEQEQTFLLPLHHHDHNDAIPKSSTADRPSKDNHLLQESPIKVHVRSLNPEGQISQASRAKSDNSTLNTSHEKNHGSQADKRNEQVAINLKLRNEDNHVPEQMITLESVDSIGTSSNRPEMIINLQDGDKEHPPEIVLTIITSQEAKDAGYLGSDGMPSKPFAVDNSSFNQKVSTGSEERKSIEFTEQPVRTSDTCPEGYVLGPDGRIYCVSCGQTLGTEEKEDPLPSCCCTCSGSDSSIASKAVILDYKSPNPKGTQKNIFQSQKICTEKETIVASRAVACNISPDVKYKNIMEGYCRSTDKEKSVSARAVSCQAMENKINKSVITAEAKDGVYSAQGRVSQVTHASDESDEIVEHTIKVKVRVLDDVSKANAQGSYFHTTPSGTKFAIKGPQSLKDSKKVLISDQALCQHCQKVMQNYIQDPCACKKTSPTRDDKRLCVLCAKNNSNFDQSSLASYDTERPESKDRGFKLHEQIQDNIEKESRNSPGMKSHGSSYSGQLDDTYVKYDKITSKCQICCSKNRENSSNPKQNDPGAFFEDDKSSIPCITCKKRREERNKHDDSGNYARVSKDGEDDKSSLPCITCKKRREERNKNNDSGIYARNSKDGEDDKNSLPCITCKKRLAERNKNNDSSTYARNSKVGEDDKNSLPCITCKKRLAERNKNNDSSTYARNSKDGEDDKNSLPCITCKKRKEERNKHDDSGSYSSNSKNREDQYSMDSKNRKSGSAPSSSKRQRDDSPNYYQPCKQASSPCKRICSRDRDSSSGRFCEKYPSPCRNRYSGSEGINEIKVNQLNSDDGKDSDFHPVAENLSPIDRGTPDLRSQNGSGRSSSKPDSPDENSPRRRVISASKSRCGSASCVSEEFLSSDEDVTHLYEKYNDKNDKKSNFSCSCDEIIDRIRAKYAFSGTSEHVSRSHERKPCVTCGYSSLTQSASQSSSPEKNITSLSCPECAKSKVFDPNENKNTPQKSTALSGASNKKCACIELEQGLNSSGNVSPASTSGENITRAWQVDIENYPKQNQKTSMEVFLTSSRKKMSRKRSHENMKEITSGKVRETPCKTCASSSGIPSKRRRMEEESNDSSSKSVNFKNVSSKSSCGNIACQSFSGRDICDDDTCNIICPTDEITNKTSCTACKKFSTQGAQSPSSITCPVCKSLENDLKTTHSEKLFGNISYVDMKPVFVNTNRKKYTVPSRKKKNPENCLSCNVKPMKNVFRFRPKSDGHGRLKAFKVSSKITVKSRGDSDMENITDTEFADSSTNPFFKIRILKSKTNTENSEKYKSSASDSNSNECPNECPNAILAGESVLDYVERLRRNNIIPYPTCYETYSLRTPMPTVPENKFPPSPGPSKEDKKAIEENMQNEAHEDKYDETPDTTSPSQQKIMNYLTDSPSSAGQEDLGQFKPYKSQPDQKPSSEDPNKRCGCKKLEQPDFKEVLESIQPVDPQPPDENIYVKDRDIYAPENNKNTKGNDQILLGKPLASCSEYCEPYPNTNQSTKPQNPKNSNASCSEYCSPTSSDNK